jgi:lipid A ethanolaminephosphotransferase
MSLKLFRSTGYSSILTPGETRVLRHPAWVVAAVSAWVGLVCNPALWHTLLGGGGAAWALTAGLATGAAAGVVLSLMGWRRTLKPTATLLLLTAALLACGIFLQDLPVDATLLDRKLRTLMPGWPSLLRWQTPALLAMLVLPPLLWMWNAPLRRLSGPEQLRHNLLGAGLGLALLAAAALMLMRI